MRPDTLRGLCTTAFNDALSEAGARAGAPLQNAEAAATAWDAAFQRDVCKAHGKEGENPMRLSKRVNYKRSHHVHLRMSVFSFTGGEWDHIRFGPKRGRDNPDPEPTSIDALGAVRAPDDDEPVGTNAKPPRAAEGEEEQRLLGICAEQGYNPLPTPSGATRHLYNHQYEDVKRFHAEMTATIDGVKEALNHIRSTRLRVLCKNAFTNAVAGVSSRARVDRSGVALRGQGLPPYGIIIGDVPGLGKTTSSLLCAALAKAASGRRCAVVVAPLALHQQWQDEVAETFPTWVVVQWSDTTSRAVFDPALVDVLIIGYEALAAAFKRTFVPPLDANGKPKFDTVKASRTGDPLITGFVRTEGPPDPIFQGSYAAFIADEGHRLRNNNTVSYHAAFAVAIRSHVRMVLTGTPLNNLMQDVVNQMLICNCRPEFQDIANFNGRVSTNFFNRLRDTSIITHDKSFLTLPPLRHWNIPVTLGGLEREAAMTTIFKALRATEDFKQKGDGFASVLVALTTMRKVAMSRHMLEYVAPELSEGKNLEREQRRIAALIAADPPEKLSKAVQLIKLLIRQQRADNPELRRKVVVFCTFIPPLMALQTMLEADPEIGRGNAPMLWGGLKASDRVALVRAPKTGVQGGRFHTNPDCKVLLANYATGGLGLNLAPAADAVVMLDVWWNPSVERQAEDRVHRLGTINPCDVYVMMNSGSFDTSCRKLYHSFKKRNGDIIMHDKRDSHGEINIDEAATVSLFIDIAKELKLDELVARFERLQGTARIPAEAQATARNSNNPNPPQPRNVAPAPNLLPAHLRSREDPVPAAAASRVEPVPPAASRARTYSMPTPREELMVRNMGLMPGRFMTNTYDADW